MNEAYVKAQDALEAARQALNVFSGELILAAREVRSEEILADLRAARHSVYLGLQDLRTCTEQTSTAYRQAHAEGARGARRVAADTLKESCRVCAVDGYGPSHDGSTGCWSGSLASGGSRAHCTCDTCF